MRSFARERRHPSFQPLPAFAGFTLLEALVIIAVIGVLVIIAIAAFGNILRRQKLSTEAREVLAAMSVARVKATSANFNYTFTFDRTNNSYQISGVEPFGPNRLYNAAFDANGNGAQDTDVVYRNPRQLQYTTFTTTSVPDPLPSGVSAGSVPANTVSVVFNPYGVVVSADNERCVVLKLGSDSQAVCAETGGLLRLYRGEGSNWVPVF
jgi:Tfp pilus assembly protein FimT